MGNDPLEVEVYANPEVVEEGKSSQLYAFASGGDGNYTYLWDPAETLDDPTSSTPVATPVEAATVYTVTVTDGEGSTARAEVTVTVSNVGVNEMSQQWDLYPNPSNGSFTIETVGDFNYVVTNSLGQQLMAGQANGKAMIDGSKLGQGVYFILLDGCQGRGVEKLVIEK